MDLRISIAVAAATIAACDPHVDASYRGDPLMKLSGAIVSSSAAIPKAVVPALGFEERPQSSPSGRSGLSDHTAFYIRAQVEGTFPSAFTMTVYDPPPSELLEPEFRDEPALAFGTIVALPEDHPAWLRTEYTPGADMAYSPERPYGDLTWRQCSDRGQCLERKYVCPADNREVPCGIGYPDGYPWGIYGYAGGHAVVYLASAAPRGSRTARFLGDGSEVAAGYHVLVLTPSRTPSLEEIEEPSQSNAETVAQECDAARTAKLFQELSAKYGKDEWELRTDPSLRRELRDAFRERAVDEPCPGDRQFELLRGEGPVQLSLEPNPRQFASLI